MRRSGGAMNARTVSPLASPLPLVGELEDGERFPWGRADFVRCWAAIQWVFSLIARLTMSFVLFVAGLMLAVATAGLACLRFAGGEVPGGLLVTGAAVALVVLWGSDACWGGMRGGSAAAERAPAIRNDAPAFSRRRGRPVSLPGEMPTRRDLPRASHSHGSMGRPVTDRLPGVQNVWNLVASFRAAIGAWPISSRR